MKKIIFLLLLSTMVIQAQNYDSQLAAKLGADELGMKNYVLVILKTGNYNPVDKAEKDSLFAGHFSNMKRLSEEGKLIVAGPLGKNNLSYRGIFILDVMTVEEARKLVETDPTVKTGVFEVELIPWYGSAALPVYLETHTKIQKKSF